MMENIHFGPFIHQEPK